MNSGPDGEFLVGSWHLSLPVERWRAWFWADGLRSTDDWGQLPDAVLLVYVYHPEGQRTRMVACDAYPPPPGVEGEPRLGVQIGTVGCEAWRRVRAEIEEQA